MRLRSVNCGVVLVICRAPASHLHLLAGVRVARSVVLVVIVVVVVVLFRLIALANPYLALAHALLRAPVPPHSVGHWTQPAACCLRLPSTKGNIPRASHRTMISENRPACRCGPAALRRTQQKHACGAEGPDVSSFSTSLQKAGACKAAPPERSGGQLKSRHAPKARGDPSRTRGCRQQASCYGL